MTGTPLARVAGGDEFFAAQPTPARALPDPMPLVENLTRCAIEVLAGARDLDQMSRWVTEDVYRRLLKRTVLASRARALKRQPAVRPQFRLGEPHLSSPADGVVEAVVVVHGSMRTRAVAIRLEGLDSRWRATALSVL